jgi:hypothetical protein
MVEDEIIANQLEALLTSAITNQENYYRQLGLRDRILNLPLMVAAVLTLLWRDVPGVTELTRILARAGFLWCNPTQISQSNQNAIDFVTALAEAKKLIKEDENNREVIIKLLSVIYQKDSKALTELL